MDLDEYQYRAKRTVQPGRSSEAAEQIAVLGLAGEAASIASAYKKRLRDGSAYTFFEESIAEELGDVLWYVAALASYHSMSLNQIAESNLNKTASWFLPTTGVKQFFDDGFPDEEQLPRRFEVEFIEDLDTRNVMLMLGGQKYGATLNDNSLEEDGYRYHDALHFAFWTFLAWSPVMRALLRRKRKSRPEIDNAEDGARAAALEEGVSAAIFSQAKRHRYFRETDAVDYGLLASISSMTASLEVRSKTLYDWKQAVVSGSRAFIQLYEARGGTLLVDAVQQTLVFRAPRR